MTSAESTLLGIVIGAALTWLSNALTNHSQWRREEWRTQRERRAELYQDMDMRAAHLTRVHRMLEIPGQRPAAPTPEEIVEHDRWFTRVAFFASPDVDRLWTEWFNIQMESLEVRRSAATDDPQARQRYLDLLEKRGAARTALVTQMRNELETKPGWRPLQALRGRGRSQVPSRQIVDR